MWASLARGIATACIAVTIMSVVTVFISGGNAWFGITPGTLVMMFTYTYTVTNQFNFINTGLQRINQAFGDASGMTAMLDEPRLVADIEAPWRSRCATGPSISRTSASTTPTAIRARRCSTGSTCRFPLGSAWGSWA